MVMVVVVETIVVVGVLLVVARTCGQLKLVWPRSVGLVGQARPLDPAGRVFFDGHGGSQESRTRRQSVFIFELKVKDAEVRCRRGESAVGTIHYALDLEPAR